MNPSNVRFISLADASGQGIEYVLLDRRDKRCLLGDLTAFRPGDLPHYRRLVEEEDLVILVRR